MKLSIKVVPGASKSEIIGWMGDLLKIRVVVQPEKGKANREVKRLLSKVLEIPSCQIRLERGATSERKVVDIKGLTREETIQRLSRASHDRVVGSNKLTFAGRSPHKIQ